MKDRMVRRLIAAIAISPMVLGIVAGVSLPSQIIHAVGPLPSFEVATIKPGSDPSGDLAVPPENKFVSSNVTARDLIRTAYGLPPGAGTRVVGGLNWVDSKRYDVDAKIPDALFVEMQTMAPEQRREQLLLMVEALLADRYKLKVHFETREARIYELVVAKGGPKLTPADAPQTETSEASSSPPTLLVRRKTSTITEMTAKRETLDAVVEVPFFGLGAPIVNKTGLSGRYDFTLDWTPDQPAILSTDGPSAPTEQDRPSLFTALEQQLGLKLVQTKGPVESIVIDHIGNAFE